MLPKTVSLANTLSIYEAVCSPGLIPGIYAPDLFKLSETSIGKHFISIISEEMSSKQIEEAKSLVKSFKPVYE